MAVIGKALESLGTLFGSVAGYRQHKQIASQRKIAMAQDLELARIREAQLIGEQLALWGASGVSLQSPVVARVGHATVALEQLEQQRIADNWNSLILQSNENARASLYGGFIDLGRIATETSSLWETRDRKRTSLERIRKSPSAIGSGVPASHLSNRG